MYRNLGNGKFEELLDKPGPPSRKPTAIAESFGDFDKDGDVDIVLVNVNESPALLRNEVKETNY